MKKYIICFFIILALAFLFCAGGNAQTWLPDKPDKNLTSPECWDDTLSNFNYQQLYYERICAKKLPSGLYAVGLDYDDPTNNGYLRGPVIHSTLSPDLVALTSRDGDIYIQDGTTPTFWYRSGGVWFDNSAGAATAGVNALVAEGVGLQGNITLTASTGASISKHVATKTITVTNAWGEYEDINIQTVDGGNTSSPTSNFYGTSDLVGSWAMEFAHGVTDTINFNLDIPNSWDTDEPVYLYATCFVPAVGYPTQCARFKLSSNNITVDPVVQITATNNWLACASSASPYDAASGTIKVIPITVTAANNNWSKGTGTTLALQRLKYWAADSYGTSWVNDLTGSFNILNLRLRGKTGQ